MSKRAAAFWVLAFALLALAGVARLLDEGGNGRRASAPAARSTASGRVVRVIDGDTVRVRLDDGTRTVRYIGVDTPETVAPGRPVECYGERASAFNRHLVAGKPVKLRIGAERFDRYRRLLAYVYLLDGRSVSAVLLARGYGRALAISPNTAHARRFAFLEARARRQGRGLWSACPTLAREWSLSG
jgi:micrococcal nuclease